MPGPWNPNAHAVLGLEWMPDHVAGQSLYSGPYRAQVLRSTVNEPVDGLRFGIRGPGANTSQPLYVVGEIYDLADLVPSPAVIHTDYAPVQDGDITVWRTQSGSATNLWASIDDPVRYPPVGADWIVMSDPNPSLYRCFVGSGNFPLTSRVHRLSIAAVISNEVVNANVNRQFAFRLHHIPTGQAWQPQSTQWGHYYGVLVEIDCGEINPLTGLPWSPQDVRKFAPGGEWNIRVESVATTGCRSRVHNMCLRVYHTPNDPRVAVGMWARPPGSPAALGTFNQLVEPDGSGDWTPGWSKQTGHDYAVLLRRAHARALTGTQTLASDIAWAFIGDERRGGTPAPVAGMHSRQVTTDTLGRIVSVGARTELNGRLDLLVGGNLSVDSQPYTIEQDPNAPLANRSRRTVSLASGGYIAQRVTPGANQSYLGVEFVVRPPTNDPNATLAVTVHRVSDSTQIGGELVVTAAQALAGQPMPNQTGYRLVQGFLDAGVSLVAATQYEIRFTPRSGNAQATWEFMAARGDGSPSSATVGFGGTTDGIVDKGTVYNQFDIGAILIAQPAAPSDVRATVVPMDAPGDGTFCSVDRIDVVVVEWSATSLGGGFARYEVERLEDGGVWEPVAVALREDRDPSAGAIRNWVEDWQARRNRPVRYRVRVITTAGAFSEWAETDWVTPRSYGAEMLFVSNVDPTLNLAYDRVPEITYTDLNNDTDELVPIYGSFGHVSFSEREDRGVGARTTLIVNYARQPYDLDGRPIGGKEIFEPLRRLVRAMSRAENPIPYICVLDYQGNRWFGRVQILDMTENQPMHRYMAEIEVVPLTNTQGVLEAF